MALARSKEGQVFPGWLAGPVAVRCSGLPVTVSSRAAGCFTALRWFRLRPCPAYLRRFSEPHLAGGDCSRGGRQISNRKTPVEFRCGVEPAVRRRLRERLLRRYFAVASGMGKGPLATPEPASDSALSVRF